MPFEEYLKLPGYSHSFLKREQFGLEPLFKVTDKVIIGKLVDGILTDPGSVNMRDPLYKIARDIAARITAEFGYSFTVFQKQISYTADMEHEGLFMAVKMRLDWLFPDYAVIDLKVTSEKDVHGLIKYMGYDNQLWGYARAAKVDRRLIMIYSIPLRTTTLIPLKPMSDHNDFWAEKTLKFGRVAA